MRECHSCRLTSIYSHNVGADTSWMCFLGIISTFQPSFHVVQKGGGESMSEKSHINIQFYCQLPVQIVYSSKCLKERFFWKLTKKVCVLGVMQNSQISFFFNKPAISSKYTLQKPFLCVISLHGLLLSLIILCTMLLYGLSHKDWVLLNSQIWLAEIEIESGLDFPI